MRGCGLALGVGEQLVDAPLGNLLGGRGEGRLVDVVAAGRAQPRPAGTVAQLAGPVAVAGARSLRRIAALRDLVALGADLLGDRGQRDIAADPGVVLQQAHLQMGAQNANLAPAGAAGALAGAGEGIPGAGKAGEAGSAAV